MLGESMKRGIMEALAEYKTFGGSLLSAVTITNVELSPDLRAAKVYFYSYLLDISDKQLVQAFEREKKSIRSFICGKFGSRLRVMPELYFQKDKMLESMEATLVR